MQCGGAQGTYVITSDPRGPHRETQHYVRPSGLQEIAALVTGHSENPEDVVMRYRDGSAQNISVKSPFYFPARYPLMFPTGEGGWYPAMVKGNSRKRLTLLEYLKYLLQDRLNVYNLPTRGGTLMQEFVCVAYQVGRFATGGDSGQCCTE
eukprot:GHVU01081557.1.p1 GENE.GHVU01081557.1~~GHVU01081557.1.p1  ORF type:complete len:150 (-),score=7.75 GHVU01081557.1:575-1024(-)